MGLFFVLFVAMYILTGTLIRLIQAKTAGTSFGSAIAFIH